MPPTNVFICAAELIADPRAWTTGAMARDAAAREVSPLHPAAVAWDIVGAVMRCAGRAGGLLAIEAERDTLTAVTGRVGLTVWNDGAGHARVLEALRQAASRL